MIFLLIPDQGSPSTLEGKYQEGSLRRLWLIKSHFRNKERKELDSKSKCGMNWVLKAKRKKKKLELTLLKVGMCREKKRKCRKMARKKPNNKRMGQRKMKKMESKRNLSHGKKWSLVWSPLNTYFGLFILSFMNLNLGLHYVLWKSISIKYGYLNWRALSWKKKEEKENPYNQWGCTLFPLPQSSFWINHPFWMNFEFSSAW